jgi:hypothetical protein
LRRLVYLASVALDGFIAGPDGGDPSGEGYFPLHADLVEFIAAEFPETLPGPARQAMGIDGPKHFDTVSRRTVSLRGRYRGGDHQPDHGSRFAVLVPEPR